MENTETQIEHYTLMEQHSKQALVDLKAALYHFRQLREESREGDFMESPTFESQISKLDTLIRLLEHRHDIWTSRLALVQDVVEGATGYY